MGIKYVQIINSFVSTEGSNGFMTNYVYYTLLVVNRDGSAEIAEGRLHEISYLLPYVRTPMDEIEELKETVRNLREDINEIADQKTKYVIDTLFPIPDIMNKNEIDAFELLEKAGFQPVLLNAYPPETPRNGIVRAFERNSENFKMVDVTIIHDVPAITGLQLEAAQAQLAAAGFRATVTRKVVSGQEDGIVLECTREDENALDVALLVANAVPETRNLPTDEAVNLLNAAGYQSVIMKVIHPGEPDRVIRWESVDDRTVKLYVGIPAVCKAKRVDVKWSNMQDSTGDFYSAEAEFHNGTQTLELKLTYTVGVKTKRQLIGTEMEVASRMFSIKGNLQGDPEMKPGVQSTATVAFSLGHPHSELSKEAKVILLTQYGIMKKTEAVALQLSFEW